MTKTMEVLTLLGLMMFTATIPVKHVLDLNVLKVES